MADSIKIGNLDISAFKVGSSDCKIYLGDTLLYPQGQPPTPTNYKWLATYTGGSVTSAECDSTTAITSGEITLEDLVDVEIGDCVTTIGDSAFEAADTLSSVTIGSGVTSIGRFAFADCTSLTSIVIPNSVTTIGGDALSYCTSLTSVTIGSGVTSIDNYAFVNCNSLTKLTIEATTPPRLEGSGAFEDTNDCPIYVPCDSLAAYQSAWDVYASRIQCIPT